MAANHFLLNSQHGEATTITPFIGGGIAWGIRWLRRYPAYKQLVELETRWLNEAVAQRDKSGLPKKKQGELAADIAERRKALQELQRENTRVQ